MKFDNSNTEEGGLSRRTGSFTKRFLAMTGATALVVGGVGSVFIGATAASAATTINTSNYIVGSQVTGLSVGLSNLTAGSNTVYTTSFVATDGVGTAGTITLKLTGGTTVQAIAASTPSVAITSGGNTVVATSSITYASGVTTGVTTVAIKLPAGASIAAGSAVSMTFTTANDAAGTYTATLADSVDSVYATAANTFTVATAAPAATTDSLSSPVLGGPTKLTVGNVELYSTTAPAATTSSWTAASFPIGTVLTLGLPNGTFTSTATDYTITVTNSAGTVISTTNPTSATAGTNNVDLVVSTAIPAGDYVSISAANVLNPGTGTTVTPTLTPAPTTGTDWLTGAGGGAAPTTSNATFSALSLGSPTAVTALAVTPASATTGASTSYSVGFKAVSALSTSQLVHVTLASGTVLGTSAYFVDTTAGTSGPATVVPGVGAAANTGTVSVPTAVTAGDSISITLLGVTNPSAAGSDSASVYTDSDTISTSASYSLTAASTTTSTPTVTLSSSLAGGASTYTISNVSASAAFPVGVSSTTPQIGLYFPTGTGLPTATSQYTITDLTNSSGTGAPATVTVDTTVAGDTGVTLTVSKAIAQGDQLKIAISNVINPAAGTDVATLSGLVASTVSVAPTFPTTAMTYPNGAFVQSGAQIDVIAGGIGFGISTQAAFGQLQAMNPASVVTGTFPTATGPRAGTLIQVAGSAGIWVVGTDGKIYQFSSASQFMADGYSPMQVVEVPSSGGLTAGTGVPPTAATTMADGSIQNFGGTFYVYDGGHAFGISTQAQAAAVEASTGSTVITGSGSAPASSTIADGSLIQPVGSAGIYVTSGGSANQFNSGTQLRANGYTGMYVVAVPSLGSVTVA
ncbi:unnamed protein product [Acidithrix sp. C25]|nr:unnamed protein product [Acidithrix sp. C25]